MRLTVFNGSPRVKKSNTALLLDHFLSGFTAGGGAVEDIHYLAQGARRQRQVDAFASADTVLMAFPLYADAMPAPVKELVEALAPLAGGVENPKLLFLVQSGFPEACHSRPLEKWLDKFARRMNSPYLGTIVKGGGEGIRELPAIMTDKVFARFRALGFALARTGRLDPELCAAIAGPERYSRASMLLLGRPWLSVATGWWKQQLYTNAAYEQRHATPYEPKSAR